jgi:hypothetical protein
MIRPQFLVSGFEQESLASGLDNGIDLLRHPYQTVVICHAQLSEVVRIPKFIVTIAGFEHAQCWILCKDE